MSDINGIKEISEGLVLIKFRTIDQYSWKDPILMNKLKTKNVKSCSFHGGF